MVRGKPCENQGQDLLPIDVAVGVSVFVNLHGRRIFRLLEDSAGERLLQRATGAVGNVPAFRLEARADIFPEQLREIDDLAPPRYIGFRQEPEQVRRSARERLGAGDPDVDVAAMVAMLTRARSKQENFVP